MDKKDLKSVYTLAERYLHLGVQMPIEPAVILALIEASVFTYRVINKPPFSEDKNYEIERMAMNLLLEKFDWSNEGESHNRV